MSSPWRNLAVGVLLAVSAFATSGHTQERVDVSFSVTHSMPDGTWDAFVLGDLPELGGANVTRAVKLRSSDRIYWSATISLPVNRTYRYSFYRRQTGPSIIGDPDNGVPITQPEHGQTPEVELEPAAKTVHYHSTFDTPTIYWRQEEGLFAPSALDAFGPGRHPGEKRWIASELGESRRALEFYFTDSTGTQRDPSQGAYVTEMDEPLVQDGALFSYLPAPAPGRMRRDYAPDNPPAIHSSILGQRRQYRVMLPRGYDQHTDRSYPVLYMYDGWVLWDFFPQVDYDHDGQRMAELVRSGRAGEVIMVGIDFLGSWEPCRTDINRARDCLSPEDTIDLGCAVVTGEADRFLAFLTTELKPLVDATYRTLPGKEHTFAQGYSLGGVFAMYAGWEHSDTFGGIASQAGSFWVPNFPGRIMHEEKRDVRIYMDTGTVQDNYWEVIALRDNLIGKAPPYVVKGDQDLHIGFGHNHSWASGGERLPEVMDFLYPASAESAGVTLGDRFCTGNANSTGQAALLYADGSSSVSAEDLAFHAIRVPAGEPALLFMGTEQQEIPMSNGSGMLCAGGTLTRLVVTQSDGAGYVVAAPPLAGSVQPGDVRSFQIWYRDGTDNNTTDGLAIQFE